MKDLEKIKSEDLAAQVQDANPANFAIEQEVAQLVGATVPQPTEPSADDARELEAQLLVFLRRALTPIQLALRTALAAIYAHLDSRCTDYTPAAYAPFTPTHHAYDPMGSTPRTLPNLLQALTAFSARKISNGSAPNDGIPDGISLVHLLCGDYASVTEIKDDNKGWNFQGSTERNTTNRISNLIAAFPNATKMSLGMKKIEGNIGITSTTLQEFNLDELESVKGNFYVTMPNAKISAPNLKEVNLNQNYDYGQCFPYGKELYFPKLCKIYGYNRLWQSGDLSKLERIVLGSLNNFGVGTWDWVTGDASNLLDFEFGADGGAGLQVSQNLSWWTATNVLSGDALTTFLHNFKEHIALRLTANGSGLTLTLSQAVFSAVIEGSSPICDDIKGIIEDKGWKVQDTNNNIFPTT